MNKTELTPVQCKDGLYFKRDDLFRPYGTGTVNGGKLRQCIYLVDSLNGEYQKLITYCSIHSPQAPITAAVALSNNLPCEILYGGTTAKQLKQLPMPRLCMRYGAKLHIVSKSGRHNILFKRARELAKKDHAFIVQYGINIMEHRDVLLRAVSEQVKNIPDVLDNLIMVCGSGITATGVLIGLKLYNKDVKNVHLVATAPDRQKFIHDNLKMYDADREFIYHDLFSQPGFQYEKNVTARAYGITFHPHYEAKMMQWYKNHKPQGTTLFWITGAEPREEGTPWSQ